ncbi:oxoglutarate/malate carrier protein [Peziza echinospora]|nr:oxoglutarate/malate carrier protein [Peziza echinospora]
MAPNTRSSGTTTTSSQQQQQSTPSTPSTTKTTKTTKYPFWFGGSASCLAAFFTHPLDLVKVRLQTGGAALASSSSTVGVGGDGAAAAISSSSSKQLGKPGMVGTFVRIVRHEGFLTLYSGLSASLLRQATYSTTRFGVYEYLKTALPLPTPTPHNPAPTTQSFTTLLLLATVSGMLGGIAGNPADIINVRMQSGNHAHYKHALHGLLTLVRTEGPATLFRGVAPNTIRAGLMTAAQLASYDVFKGWLVAGGPLVGGRWDPKGVDTHFVASVAAGLVATTVCSPVDVIKTRVMSSRRSAGGSGGGVLEVLRDTVRKEGVTWVFRGWIPSFARLGPHTILMFVFMEQHKKVWDLWVRKGEEVPT